MNDFLADVEFAAKAFDKLAGTTDTRLTLFRQNLQDYTIKWWNLEVSNGQKGQYGLQLLTFSLQSPNLEVLLMRNSYGLQKDINLKQGENKSITSYADRAKMISKRDNGSLGNPLARTLFKGCVTTSTRSVSSTQWAWKIPVTLNTVLEFVEVSCR